MLTKIKISNFKRFDSVEIELGKVVVLIGPNNSGKTTALQALALWDIGLQKWLEKRAGKSSPEQRPGVTINRNDLISIPIPDANLLWRDLHTREHRDGGTQNIRIDIVVEGILDGEEWKCGLEFDYANDESFYCRPLRLNGKDGQERMSVPPNLGEIKLAFLPPMSGLSAIEPKWEPGRISVLLGEGQTAQVLRNLCYQLIERKSGWNDLEKNVKSLFGVTLLPPKYIKERGEITMSYKEEGGVELDLSSSGRGLQQTVLLLAYLYANPGTILLLDEPDAHLEILRQREIYHLISNLAGGQGSQLIAASHSEIVLNEAVERDTVVAFVGKPHTLSDRGSQVMKALAEIGFDKYYQAELKGWVLYLEGSSDLSILQAFAERLGHPATASLRSPFVIYIATNLPQRARDNFYGLREARTDLVGIALFDHLDKSLQEGSPLFETMWDKREIENYLCTEHTLLAYASQISDDDLIPHTVKEEVARRGKREIESASRFPLFAEPERERRLSFMREAIQEVSAALQTLRGVGIWSPELKASDDVLNPIFKAFFSKLKLPNIMSKSDYHALAQFVPLDAIDSEIKEKLDLIVRIEKSARLRNS